jgi:hypothetical protein
VGAADVRLAALLGLLEAEEADNVGVVGVEVLARSGGVDADLVDLGGVVAEVLDVAEDVALVVLRDGDTDRGTDGEVDGARLLDGPLLDGEALDQDEAGTVDRGLADLGEESADILGEGEGLLSPSAAVQATRWAEQRVLTRSISGRERFLAAHAS